MRVTVSNFVNIGQTIAEILQFYGFPKGRPPPSWIFENSNSYLPIRLRDQICVTVLNFIKIGRSVAEIWRFFYYSRWRPSAMLDFYNCDFKCSAAQGVPMRATMSNFVKIIQMVAENCDFTVFRYGGRRHLGFSKIQILNG